MIAIADPLLAGDRMGGRCRAITLSQLALDAQVLFTPGESYSIMVVMPDGSVAVRGLVTPDLHDDLGATLLTIAQAGDAPHERHRIARLARQALDEMRLSVRGLAGEAAPVHEAWADWRSETVTRLMQAGIRTNGLHALHPVHHRHVPVENEEIDLLRAHGVDCLFAILRLDDGESNAFDDASDHFAHDL